MSGLPDKYDLAQCERFLRELGAARAPLLPIADAALALASFDRPRVGLARYSRHLRVLAQDVARRTGTALELEARATALNEVMLLKHGYSGDELTYDDLQNANLMRVIDRRKGLPVALGILYLDVARAQGWDAVGLGFPGHFLVRLSDGGGRLILDPFHDGRVLDAVALRELLKAIAGQAVELAPEHYAPVPDREVLLRLQNNLKSRLIQGQRNEEAVRVIETMRMLAPDFVELSREAGLIHAQLGNMRAAVSSIEDFVARAPEGAARHEAAVVLQRLKQKLN
ncbi:MAG TPA: transglutaminase-like domain-containing protein [Stellaceae bacterium]|jgi:regulator of sirC expression with transglutaminase-like and TPR domain|nr:transglutaminase-like domain-containing protein [Stellaceae bacterium]